MRSRRDCWPLRYLVPTAFVAQIRRVLECVCEEQGAVGRHLFQKLENLANRGTFPGHLRDITHRIRKVGNERAHAGGEDSDVWGAERIDEFFRFVVEYVYVAPARLKRFAD